MPHGGVYEVLNTVNGRRYIGASTCLKRRFQRHQSELRGGVHPCRELQEDFDRYGEDAFIFNVLEEIEVSTDKRHFDEQELRLAEQRYLNTVPDTYNLRHVRMEPLNEIGSLEWIAEMREIIDRVRPPSQHRQPVPVPTTRPAGQQAEG